MALVEPGTLSARGVTLAPLSLEHDAGLRVAADDGELWNIRVTSVPEPENTHKYIEDALAMREAHTYEVRCIDGSSLLPLLEQLGPPLSAFSALRGDGEGIVAGVERWMCNNKGPRLVSWNAAMTAA